MARKTHVVSLRIASAVVAVALVATVIGCSQSPGGGDALVTGSQPVSGAPEAGSQEGTAPDSGTGTGPVNDEAAAREPTAAPEPTAGPASTAAAAAPESDSPSADMVGPIQSTPREDVPSALRDRFHSGHPEPLVDV